MAPRLWCQLGGCRSARFHRGECLFDWLENLWSRARCLGSNHFRLTPGDRNIHVINMFRTSCIFAFAQIVSLSAIEAGMFSLEYCSVQTLSSTGTQTSPPLTLQLGPITPTNATTGFDGYGGFSETYTRMWWGNFGQAQTGEDGFSARMESQQAEPGLNYVGSFSLQVNHNMWVKRFNTFNGTDALWKATPAAGGSAVTLNVGTPIPAGNYILSFNFLPTNGSTTTKKIESAIFFTNVPEPSTTIAFGLFGMLSLVRRRR